MTRKALREGQIQKNRASDDGDNEEVNDPRFSKALNNPLFKKISNEKKKVVLDDRFKAVLTDDRFRILPGGNVDAYGRKIKRKSKEKQALNELKSYYTLEEDQKESEPEEDEEEVEEKKYSNKANKSQKSLKAVASIPRSDEDHLEYLNKLARGEISGEDSDEESDDSDADEDDADRSEHDEDSADGMEVEEAEDYAGDYKSPLDIPGEEEDDVEYGEATRRISILNCDWENIKSTDLMMILQSFCPPGKKVLSVTIYPSDFGKEKMAEEAKYGPQSIWKKKSTTEEMNEEEDENEDEPDENEDLYEDIEDYGSDNSEEEADEIVERDEEEEADHSRDKKAFGDFQRKKGAVGLILHDDLKQRRQHHRVRTSSMTSSQTGGESITSSQIDGNQSQTSSTNKKPNKKQTVSESDIDEVALRQYELSKLRYYFAIAECDTVDTANLLYEQLDDVELGDTAMAIELRFVPDDLDLSSREVRDSCRDLPHHYKPPSFVINALQHTKVECSWDRGETEREKKLTNISSWRELKESELMQYIASSDSEDYEEDEEENERNEGEEEGSYRQPSVGSIKSLKKKKRAKQLRKLLLGEDSGGNGKKDHSDQEEEEEHDDFFTREDNNNDDDDDDDDDDDEDHEDDGMPQPDENGEITMTYLPEAGSDLLAKKQLAKQQQSLTPYELELQKMAEKKKLKKQQRKEYIREKQAEQHQLLEQAKEQYYQKKKRLSPEEEQNRAYLEYEDSDRLLPATTGLKPWELQHKESMEKKQKKLAKKLAKQKQKKGQEAEGDEEEKKKEVPLVGLAGKEIDTTDRRFQKVFEGNDANFGIDRTSTEFKATPAMERLLVQQRQQREKKRQQQATIDSENTPIDGNGKEEVHSLANKLKRKFAAVK